MTTADRIVGFSTLGEELNNMSLADKAELFSKAAARNAWFTHQNIDLALAGIALFLNNNTLSNWLAKYKTPNKPLKVGLVLAGNIPLVGFHDFMSVILAGHIAIIKPSSQDTVLLKYISDLLLKIDPKFSEQIEYVDRLTGMEAVIATGSGNSSRYFKKYFQSIPHIIRKNRTSVAILHGKESAEELALLSDDIFSFFGLGCRNVAKIYIPQGYAMTTLLDNLTKHEEVKNHPKYFNNYEYNKAIYLVNCVEHLDTGYALFRQSADLVSPLSVIYYEEYQDLDKLEANLTLEQDKLQCIVSNTTLNNFTTVPFGKAQFPEIDDYADNIDTMHFLCNLGKG